MYFSVLELPTLKMFLICSYFLPVSVSLFLQILYYGSYSGTWFLYKQLQLLGVEVQNGQKLSNC